MRKIVLAVALGIGMLLAGHRASAQNVPFNLGPQGMHFGMGQFGPGVQFMNFRMARGGRNRGYAPHAAAADRRASRSAPTESRTRPSASASAPASEARSERRPTMRELRHGAQPTSTSDTVTGRTGLDSLMAAHRAAH